MIAKKALLLLCLLIGIGLAQAPCVENDPQLLKYLKKGMTYQVQQWPNKTNNYVGKMACQGCDPSEGDQPCTNELPILCIVSHKKITRPLYNYSPLIVPYENPDRGFYNGWTGGIFTVTQPVRGYDVDSYDAGNTLCQAYWGKNAKFAEFSDGYYMDWMNNRPIKAWKFWDWTAANCGGWGFWGYFNHNYNGRAWVWIYGQPHSNCGSPQP